MELSPDQRDWLALALSPGIGGTRMVKLLARFGTPGRVLAASEAELAEVLGDTLAQRLRAYREVSEVAEQEARMRDYEAWILTLDDPRYPLPLAEIYDPPMVLWGRGTLEEVDGCAVAIVGTRHATEYGIKVARRLAGELAARDVTIISGLAAGIDTAAHEAAIEAGGRTIAVLGNGVDIVFPAENAALMHNILRQGCVVSPFPMGTKGFRGNFPQRNRIISGLSLGVVVVEAPPGSGSLLTARDAAEQGREVFAVPGQITNRNSLGPHSLIKEGAKLIETVEDILVELNVPASVRQGVAVPAGESSQQELALPEVAPPRPAPPANLSPTESTVLASLSPDGSFVDEISLVCRIPVSEALSTLTMLELKGLARQFSGKRFAPR
jgi:DNA processing protein